MNPTPFQRWRACGGTRGPQKTLASVRLIA